MRPGKAGFATRAIHYGHDPYAGHGGLVPPIHVSSTYAFPRTSEGSSRFAGESEGYIYSRLGNPTTALLETRMAVLEGAEAALACASGMGAIASTLWTLLRPGDELITDRTLYGCTFAFFHHGLRAFGVEVRHVDLRDSANLERAITPRAKGVFFESVANPNMRVVDTEGVCRKAREHGLWTVVDNTYLSPFFLRPIELGADFVVHSATKYLSGHGDLLAGIVAGSQAGIDQIRMQGLKDFTGAVLSSLDAHQILRGLKTLSLRMERHQSSALRVAQFLRAHPAVEQVFYPGLASDPGYRTLSQQGSGFGGVVALELRGGRDAAVQFMDSLGLFIRAVSLGDCESLVQHPASMTHSTYTPEERLEHGISDGLIRLSVGLEDPDDLLSDLDQALCRLK